MKNNKVYIAGDMLTLGSQMLRAKEREEIKALGLDFYNPADNKEINDKSNLDNNEGLAEKIVRADTKAIRESDIIVIEPQPFALGTMVELGQIKGMKDIAKDIYDIITTATTDEIALLDIWRVIYPIYQQKVYPHYEDIRRFDGVTETEDRRSLGINQYVYGVCLSVTDGTGFYEWDEIIQELNKME